MSTSLRVILFDLNHRATKTQGVRFSKTLGGGLVITVMVFDGKTWLALSRPDVLPSRAELETIAGYWPYAIPPAATEAEREYSLVLCWTTPSVGEFVNLPHSKGVSMETPPDRGRKSEGVSPVRQLSFFDENAPVKTGAF